MAALLDLQRVTAGYGGRPAVVDVTLEIGAGELVGVVGPSGSGKTTLLRLALGSLAPASGQVRRAPGLRLGYVPQVETVSWSFPVTVEEVVLMAVVGGRFRWPWPSRAERARAGEVVERLGLGGLAGRHIRELSGGQQQRVFVARALMAEPDLLLLDEPTSGVDVRTRHDVLHLLGELHGAGQSIVLTTHDLNGIAAHLPRLLCVNRGVVADGPSRQVLCPAVLERTFGAPMDVLDHAGMPFVVEVGGPDLRALQGLVPGTSRPPATGPGRALTPSPTAPPGAAPAKAG